MSRGRWTEAAFKRYPKRFVTTEVPVEGRWLCHDPTKTWFEFYGLTPQGIAVGFMIGGGDFHAPIAECYHSWDPKVDAR